MRIQITDKYVMTSDSCNYILNEQVIPKTGKQAGKPQLKAIAFYPRIEDLIQGVIDRKMGASTTRTMKGFLREYRALVFDLRELFSIQDIKDEIHTI